MDTPPPPPPTRWSADTNRHIPAEVMEEILLNLPLKSLIRFSFTSKSWNSIIHEASFSKKYRGGEERIIIRDPSNDEILSCPLSAVLSNSNNPTEIEEATSNHVCPLYLSHGKTSLHIIDVCNGLWFVQSRNNKAMFVWNPSTGKYRQIGSSALHYGIGYDSVADDYKILKICNDEVILESLRSKFLRRMKHFPLVWMGISIPSCCVHGTLHWFYQTGLLLSDACAIVSFDFSTEEYGEVALPLEYSPAHRRDHGEVAVLRGKLCLSLNYWKKRRFVLWVMEEYGVVESWTKKFDFDHGLDFEYGLRPLYICDDWENGICETRVTGECWVMNKDGKKLARKNLGRGRKIYGRGFVYVESPVSPATYTYVAK